MSLHSEKQIQIDSPAIYLVFTLIRQKDGISRQQLQEKLAVPATTLSRLIDKLLKAGFIEEAGFTNETGGRPASLYKVAPDSGYLIGLDLSGLSSQASLMNLNMAMLDSLTLPGMSELKPDEMAKTITKALQGLLSKHQISAQNVLGCGVGWAGYISNRKFARPADTAVVDQPTTSREANQDRSTEQDSNSSKTAYALEVCRQLSEGTDFFIAMLPGVHAALYAGIWLDRSLAEKNMIYVSAGRSIRAGIVQHGQFHKQDLTTDVIDDLLVPAKGKRYNQRLDEIATRQAMLKAYRKIRKNDQESWESFCKALEKGKKKAGQVLDDAAEAMAVAIYNTAVLSGADYLLLGGYLFFNLPAYQNLVLEKLKNPASSRQAIIFYEQTKDEKAGDDNAAERPAKTRQRQITVLCNPYEEKIIAAGAAAYVLEAALPDRLK